MADIYYSQSFNCLTLTSDSSSYELTIPEYDAKSPQYFIWIERDLGQCVLALLKHYKNDSAHILGETFYAVSDKMSYTDYANVIEKGSVPLGAELDPWYSYSWCSGRKARSFRDRCTHWNGGKGYRSYSSPTKCSCLSNLSRKLTRWYVCALLSDSISCRMYIV